MANRVGRFLREVRVELKKVAWPSRKEIRGSTWVVVIVVVLIGAFVGIIDIGLTRLLRLLVK
jgi:preprotein translocase subunit SecE